MLKREGSVESVVQQATRNRLPARGAGWADFAWRCTRASWLASTVLAISSAASAQSEPPAPSAAASVAAPSPSEPLAAAQEPAEAAEKEPTEAEKQKARQLWREALEAASRNDVELAFTRFQASYELYPYIETLRNLALVELALEAHFADGATHLAEYLARKERLAPVARKDLETTLAEAERKLAWLEVQIVPRSAVVEIDGNRVPWLDDAYARYVEPGTHEITASAPGTLPFLRKVQVIAGARESIVITLSPTAGVPASPEPSEPQQQPAAPPAALDPTAIPGDEPGPTTKFWVVAGGGALTAAALGFAVYGEVRVASTRDELDKAGAAVDDAFGQQNGCTTPEAASSPLCKSLDSAASDYDKAGTLATAGWIATGVLATATLGTWLFWPDGSSPAAMGPWATQDGAGFTLRRSF